MRFRRLLFAAAASLALVATPTTVSFAAPNGEPGRPDSPGRSEAARARSGGSSAQDATNPDGTYRGKSPSRPDQDGIGMDRGIVNEDKVGPGTDGNNGCGNDPDREDDNNGWCGRPPLSAGELRPAGVASSDRRTTSGALAANVAGVEVLGRSFTRSAPETGGLATTGGDILRLALTAGALVVVGFGIRRSSPPRSP